jgi:hypothetical protein
MHVKRGLIPQPVDRPLDSSLGLGTTCDTGHDEFETESTWEGKEDGKILAGDISSFATAHVQPYH